MVLYGSFAWLSKVIVLAIILFAGWYTVAADYSYRAVSGTYEIRFNGGKSTLILQKDQRFKQELIRGGDAEHAQGTWRRLGEGGVVFSKEYLALPGQEVRADGQADGEVEKAYGLFFSIAFNPRPGGPILKKTFR